MVVNRDCFFNILPRINLALFILSIILAIFLLGNIIRSYQTIRLNKDDFARGEKELGESRVTSLMKLPAFDKNVFTQSSLFNAPGKEAPSVSGLEVELLGIVSVGAEHAATIRDKKDNVEYYCLGGEVIGDFTVKEVFKDKVILESEDKTLELRP